MNKVYHNTDVFGYLQEDLEAENRKKKLIETVMIDQLSRFILWSYFVKQIVNNLSSFLNRTYR